MEEMCYNDKSKKPEERNRRISQIFELLKKEDKSFNTITKGKIEIHFAGDSISMSITKYCN
jgi:hypothetical protein